MRVADLLLSLAAFSLARRLPHASSSPPPVQQQQPQQQSHRHLDMSSTSHKQPHASSMQKQPHHESGRPKRQPTPPVKAEERKEEPRVTSAATASTKRQPAAKVPQTKEQALQDWSQYRVKSMHHLGGPCAIRTITPFVEKGQIGYLVTTQLQDGTITNQVWELRLDQEGQLSAHV
jgi:hypothetical protein